MRRITIKGAGDGTFWRSGLRFECVEGCTRCCEIPGYVFVHASEIQAIAETLHLTPEEFKARFLKPYWGDMWHLDFPSEKPCIFLNEKGCSIYPVRPAQCAAFPFWSETIENEKTWQDLKKLCPGIDRGRLYSPDEITTAVEKMQHLSVL
ncbi:MAG: YkgJ family cysteine cluster protein [bacterium]